MEVAIGSQRHNEHLPFDAWPWPTMRHGTKWKAKFDAVGGTTRRWSPRQHEEVTGVDHEGSDCVIVMLTKGIHTKQASVQGSPPSVLGMNIKTRDKALITS